MYISLEGALDKFSNNLSYSALNRFTSSVGSKVAKGFCIDNVNPLLVTVVVLAFAGFCLLSTEGFTLAGYTNLTFFTFL